MVRIELLLEYYLYVPLLFALGNSVGSSRVSQGFVFAGAVEAEAVVVVHICTANMHGTSVGKLLPTRCSSHEDDKRYVYVHVLLLKDHWET